VSTVSAIAGGLLVLTSRAEIEAVLRQSDPQVAQEQLDRLTLLAQAIPVAIALVIAIVYLWLSFKLKAGRNWARVTLTVFTLLQAASLLTTGPSWAGYLSCGVAVVATVLSYLPPSNRFVAGVRRAA
jgi:FtsH-binding integral membrane protein